jgi:hypothetical protein
MEYESASDISGTTIFPVLSVFALDPAIARLDAALSGARIPIGTVA